MDITTHRLLRLSLVVVFIYPPLAALADPVSWVGYLPSFLRALPVEPELILHSVGVMEIVLGVWFATGKRLLIPSSMATVFLFSVVVLNWSQLTVVFRDAGLGLVSIALGVDAWKKTQTATVHAQSEV